MVVAVMVAKQENVAAIVVVTDVVVTQLTAALSRRSLFLFTFPLSRKFSTDEVDNCPVFFSMSTNIGFNPAPNIAIADATKV